ncbi:secretory calcium-binding phosphoprotein 1 [Clinocottus analis]|uniref:secretory calcium-binding phosphoprotein 1 n=1 Tax=Clinocottus analis TaxID=304258 RepID=UPI0035C23755
MTPSGPPFVSEWQLSIRISTSVLLLRPLNGTFLTPALNITDEKTESLSVSQSSENSTSSLQSSEENTSNQSQSSESESESLESTSEDKTSEESNGLLDEDDVADFMAETRDNAMGSEENVRKSWVQLFARIIQVLSTEDNSSTEVKGQSDHLTEKEPTHTFTGTTFRQRTITNLPLVESPTNSNDTASDSANTSEVVVATKDSSESTSSESNETSDSSDSSESRQIKTRDCVNGTQSCESDEYLFQDIGDDAHYSVDSLMMPDENERELILRR